MLYLLNVEMPESKCYCVLESDIDCLSKAIHVIDFSVKTQVNVGRRVTNDITVSDISVSRLQALIKYDAMTAELYLQDCASKFGTFLRVQGVLKIPKQSYALPI